MSGGKRNDCSSCAILPADIIGDILSRLPVKSLCRFKCVSPAWNSLISSPNFSKTHLNRTNTDNPKHLDRNVILINSTHDICSLDLISGLPTEIDFPLFQQSDNKEVEVWNSCNGLVLVSESFSNLFLLNPSTRQCKKMPPLPFELHEVRGSAFSVGYDSCGDDYKVVMLSRPNVESGSESESKSSFPSDVTIVSVYSLETNAWRNIEGTRYKIDTIWPGVYCNGRLHWSCWRDDPFLLVAFDWADETFREVPLPAPFDNYNIQNEWPELVILGGCLCLVYKFCPDPVEFWMMKEYGDRESWTIIAIESHGLYIRGLVEEDEFLMLKPKEIPRGEEKLVVYNPEIGILADMQVPIRNSIFDWASAIYVESLVSPNQ